MPAELLLLLIVAFASPSCQVLSSLRMGEALQPCPLLLRDPPIGPRAPLWEPRQAVSSGPRGWGLPSQLSSALRGSSPQLLLPWTQESRPPTLFSLRSRSLDPSPHSHLRILESGPQPLCPLSCNPG